jgi:hypothetical protein
MSKKKDSLILYESFFDATADLSAESIAELWRALGGYLKDDITNITNVIPQTTEAKLAWKFIKLQLDADKKRWLNTCDKRAEAGRIGMAKRWKSIDDKQDTENVTKITNDNKDNKRVTKITNVTDTDTESDTDNNIYIRQQREERSKQITEAFASYCPSLPQIKKLDKRRLSAVLARYTEHKRAFSDFEDFLKHTFQRIEASDFLTGRSSDWQASFDWIFKPANFKKILEGNYKNREGKRNGNAQDGSNRNNGTYNEGAADYGQLD